MDKSTPSIDPDQRHDLLDLLETVDALSEQTKDLALSLALYLAKAKARKASEKLKQMEPEFIRLVNSTVKVVQELTVILNAARHDEKMVYDPPSGQVADHIQTKLEAVAQQCDRILEALQQSRQLMT